MYGKTFFLSLVVVLIFGITDTALALDLKTQAQNDVVNSFLKQLITGVFFIAFAGMTGFIAWLYSRFTGRKAESAEIKKDSLTSVSRLRRLTNFSVDFLIVINAIVTGIAYYAITIEWYAPFENWLLFSVGTIILYYWTLEGFFGRTIGKLLTGTKVVAADGSRVDASAIFVRTLIRLIPFEVFSFLGASDSGWHDRWSKTVVVRVEHKIKLANERIVLPESESQERRVATSNSLIAGSGGLNGKWWYRLMKVIYGMAFFIGAVLAVTYVSNQYKPKEVLDVSRSFIECSNNKIYTSTDLGVSDRGSEISKAWDWIDATRDQIKLKRLCITGSLDESATLSMDQFQEFHSPQEQIYRVVEEKKVAGSWTMVISLSLVAILTLAMVFWAVGKVFHYIYSGRSSFTE